MWANAKSRLRRNLLFQHRRTRGRGKNFCVTRGRFTAGHLHVINVPSVTFHCALGEQTMLVRTLGIRFALALRRCLAFAALPVVACAQASSQSGPATSGDGSPAKVAGAP